MSLSPTDAYTEYLTSYDKSMKTIKAIEASVADLHTPVSKEVIEALKRDKSYHEDNAFRCLSAAVRLARTLTC